MPLTSEQQTQLCNIVGYGVDPETAANCIEITWPELQEHLRQDLEFAVKLNRAKAKAEVNHLHNIQEAGKERRHWRASQWWLQCRASERYGPRPASSISPRQFDDFFSLILDIIAEEVPSEEIRNRMLDRILSIGEKFKATVIPASHRAPRTTSRQRLPTLPKS